MANRFAIGSTWNSTASWAETDGGAGPASIPTSSDAVLLTANSVSMTVDINADCASIDTNGYSGTLDFNGYDLTSAGLINHRGGTFTAGSGTVTATTLQVFGTGVIYNGNTSDLVLSNDMGLYIGTFNAPTGTFTVGRHAYFGTGGGSCTINLLSCSMSIAQDLYMSTSTMNAGTSTVTVTGTSKVINTGTSSSGQHFYNFVVDGSYTITNLGDLQIDNNLTINASKSLTVGAGGGKLRIYGGAISVGSGGTFLVDQNSDLYLHGTTTLSGTMSCHATSTVNYVATTGTRNILSASYGKVLINGSGGTFTLGANLSAAGTLTISAGTLTQSSTYTVACTGLTMNGGTFSGGSVLVSVDGAFTIGAGSAFTSTSGNLQIYGSCSIANGTFTHNNGKVRVLNSGTFTWDSGTNHFYNLELYLGTYTVTGDVFVDNILSYVGSPSWSGGTIQVIGDITFSSNNVPYGTTTVTWVGTATKSMTGDGTNRLPGFEMKGTGAGTLNISGNIRFATLWKETSGTINYGTSTIIASDTSSTLGPVTTDLFNLSHTSTGAVTYSGTVPVAGTLTISSNGALNTGTINAKGNIVVTGLPTGTATINICGTTPQAIGCAGGSGRIVTTTIACSSATFSDSMTYYGNLTYTSGTITHNGTSIFSASGCTYNTGAMVLKHITFSCNGGTNAITGTMLASGDLLISGNTTVTGAISVGGSVTSTAVVAAGSTATITMTGAADVNINIGAGKTVYFGAFTINKGATATVSLAANTVINSAGQDMVVTAGILDLAGFNLTVNNVFSLASGTILKLKGTETLTLGTFTKTSGSTITYYGAGTAVLAQIGAIPAGVTVRLGASKTHTWPAAGWTFAGIFESDGALGATASLLRSSIPATQRALTFSGTSNLANKVDVQDSDASSGNQVSAVGSVGAAQNNINWDFGASASLLPAWVRVLENMRAR